MVVIEPELDKPTIAENNRNPKNDPSASTTDAADSANRDASDGFETASDGDHDDSDGGGDGDGDGGRSDPPPKQHLRQQEESAAPKDDSYQDALNDEQLEQRAMAQVNDAKLEGNKLFADGKYEDALLEYERALNLVLEGPSFVELRSICHSNRAVCYLKLGKYDDTIKECTKALELNPTYMKACIRRAEAHEKLEHFEEAIADFEKVKEIDPGNYQARQSIDRLKPLAAEKREKMIEEMKGKLKELGNSVLGRFGMSVDNFKAVKDPNTGSYSISFQR